MTRVIQRRLAYTNGATNVGKMFTDSTPMESTPTTAGSVPLWGLAPWAPLTESHIPGYTSQTQSNNAPENQRPAPRCPRQCFPVLRDGVRAPLFGEYP